MLYSCKELFERVKKQVAQEIDGFPIDDPSKVCIITTGDDEPSARYVRNKLRDFDELGIVAKVECFKEAKPLLNYLLYAQDDYDGIIVQRPVDLAGMNPKEAAKMVANYINPTQDIDGVAYGSDFLPPSVRGLDILLREWNVDPAGKTAVVIGRGDVGKPVAEYLLSHDATVTICHSGTPVFRKYAAIHDADIVVGAVGFEKPLYPDVRKDAVIIDYGITKGEDGKLHGDISADAANHCTYQTAVPGGMGLMVRAGLLLNIVDAYKHRRGIE